MNEILEAALEYSKQGYSVMPIKSNSKDPLLGEWQVYSHRKSTEAEIDTWFNNKKNYNLGIVCGEASGNLEILDIDDPLILNAFFKDIKTRQIRTQSGGYHLYFKVNRFTKNYTKFHGWPIDFRTNGGFGMAPPSHLNEKKWNVARESEILKIDNLEDFVNKRLPRLENEIELEERFLKGISLKTIIKKYINTKIVPVGKDYQTNCPFPDHDDKTPSFSIYEDHYYCFGCHKIGNAIDFVQKIKKISRNEAITEIENITGTKFRKETRGTTLIKIENYLKTLAKEWNIKTTEDDIILKYENGIYIPCSKQLAENLALTFHLKNIPSKTAFFTFIRDITQCSYSEFDKNPHIINFKNGLYDIHKKILISHTPEYLALTQIPVEYHEDAKCPVTEKFISEIANKKTLWELLGYCLFSKKITQQMFLLYGGGANGKSVYMDMLGELVGEKNTARISFDAIETSRFVLSELKNKLLNISSETVIAKLKNMDQMKKLTGEHKIESEIKFVQERIKFESKATCIYGMNEIPSFDDPKYAEIRRMVLVNFPNQFKRNAADPYLLEKLTTKEEQEGQIIQGLKHLTNVIKNKEVYDILNDDEKEILLERGSNPTKAFLEDEFIWELEDNTEQIWIEGKCLYKMLEQYCNKNSLITPSNHKFKTLLQLEHQRKNDKYDNISKIDNIHSARKNINNKKLHVWKLSPIQKFEFIKESKNRDDLTFWQLSDKKEI